MNWRTRILLVIPVVVLLGIAAACLLAPEPDRPTTAAFGAAAAAHAPAVHEAVVSAPAPASSTAMVSATEPFRISGGRVDAHLDMPLSKAVATLTSTAGVDLAGGAQLPDTSVRVDLDGVGVAEALLRLTAGYDSAFQYQGTRLVRFSIQPQSADGARQATGLSAENFDRLDPEQRGDAIEGIALHSGAGAHEAVAHALSDADATVRLRALEQTQVVQGLALPTDELQKFLQQDASEDVRLKALDVLASDPGIDTTLLASIARDAQSDRSELVRTQALVLSLRLESTNASASAPAIPEGEN